MKTSPAFTSHLQQVLPKPPSPTVRGSAPIPRPQPGRLRSGRSEIRSGDTRKRSRSKRSKFEKKGRSTLFLFCASIDVQIGYVYWEIDVTIVQYVSMFVIV